MTENPSLILKENEKLLKIQGVSVVLPEEPWMPTHAGVEVRVSDQEARPLVDENGTTSNLTSELLRAGRVAMVASEVAGVFTEAIDPKNPDWYDKPWFNLNFNSHLGSEKIKFTCQVYMRVRTLGQMRGLKSKSEYKEESDKWSNPYWTVPVPVDYPLNPADRGSYEPELEEKIRRMLNGHFGESVLEKIRGVRLFTEEDGSSSLERDFPFEIGQGNYPVWQKGDYLIVTQDNPLVDREDGVHLVLIYRGEQQGEEERYSFLWRDPRRIAEMAIIAVAASKIITMYGYGGNHFDKSYIHLNANWSLSHALSEEQRHEIMDKGSVGPGKWPGPREKTVPGPNAHPHIQLLKEGHEFFLPPSAKHHHEHPKVRQTDEEIAALKDLLGDRLTPLIKSLQGKTLF